MNVSSLIRDTVRIPLSQIQEDVVRLRAEYDEAALEELKSSFVEGGLLQPIVVAPIDSETYELIIGSRRIRAAKRAGEEEIPAIVIQSQSPLNYLLMALAENLHREDLNPFEEGNAFFRLMKDYGLGTQEVASSIHKGESYIRSRLELVSLPEEVQQLFAAKKLGLQHVGLLAKLPTGEDQICYALKAVSDGLTIEELRVRITEDAVGFPSQRASRSKLSAEKVRLKICGFTDWLEKIPRKTVIRGMNSEERSGIADSLYELEVELRTLRNLFLPRKVSDEKPDTGFHAGNTSVDPRNHGADWTSRDLERITDPNRPSDQELSKELGRTISAIKWMRSKAASKP